MKLVFAKEIFLKQKHHELTGELDLSDLKQAVCTNTLVKSIDFVNYDLDIDYLDQLNSLQVNGVINYSVSAIDARTGQDIKYSDYIDWNDEYSFDQKSDFNNNIILNNEFNLFDYIIEQININIPFNLSLNNGIITKSGFGWSLLTEQDLKEEQANKIDPRWEKLDEFNKK